MAVQRRALPAGDYAAIVGEAVVAEDYLRQHMHEDPAAVDEFLGDYDVIRKTHIATHLRLSGRRFAIATTVRNQADEAVASVTLVGSSSDLQPRKEKLARLLLRHVGAWSRRSLTAREAI